MRYRIDYFNQLNRTRKLLFLLPSFFIFAFFDSSAKYNSSSVLSLSCQINVSFKVDENCVIHDEIPVLRDNIQSRRTSFNVLKQSTPNHPFNAKNIKKTKPRGLSTNGPEIKVVYQTSQYIFLHSTYNFKPKLSTSNVVEPMAHLSHSIRPPPFWIV